MASVESPRAKRSACISWGMAPARCAAGWSRSRHRLQFELSCPIVQLAAQCARAMPQLMQAERLARGLSTEAITMDAQVGNPRSRADPLQTQDDDALDVWEAMIEAGLVSEPSSERLP